MQMVSREQFLPTVRLHITGPLEVMLSEAVTEAAITLGERLITGGGLPMKARVDALHIAVAAVHGMDYLLTWNCKHIANPATRKRIEQTCIAAGYAPPILCTPEELLEVE